MAGWTGATESTKAASSTQAILPRSRLRCGATRPMKPIACQSCNRGVAGKFDRVPTERLLRRLHMRNEYLISSIHPLRETLMAQTGGDEGRRRGSLRDMHAKARATLIHLWEPRQTKARRGLVGGSAMPAKRLNISIALYSRTVRAGAGRRGRETQCHPLHSPYMTPRNNKAQPLELG